MFEIRVGDLPDNLRVGLDNQKRDLYFGRFEDFFSGRPEYKTLEDEWNRVGKEAVETYLGLRGKEKSFFERVALSLKRTWRNVRYGQWKGVVTHRAFRTFEAYGIFTIYLNRIKEGKNSK